LVVFTRFAMCWLVSFLIAELRYPTSHLGQRPRPQRLTNLWVTLFCPLTYDVTTSLGLIVHHGQLKCFDRVLSLCFLSNVVASSAVVDMHYMGLKSLGSSLIRTISTACFSSSIIRLSL